MAFLFILCLEESQAMVIREAKMGGGIERQKNKYRETSNLQAVGMPHLDRKLFKMSAGENSAAKTASADVRFMTRNRIPSHS